MLTDADLAAIDARAARCHGTGCCEHPLAGDVLALLAEVRRLRADLDAAHIALGRVVRGDANPLVRAIRAGLATAEPPA